MGNMNRIYFYANWKQGEIAAKAVIPEQNFEVVMSGYHHTTISLICMSTHKAMATRCLSYHQATSRHK